MKITATFLATAMALASSAEAAVSMTGCNISHNSSGTNQHTIDFRGFDFNVCNEWQNAIKTRATRDHEPDIKVTGLSCNDLGDGNFRLIVTLDKQACVKQTRIIIDGLKDALGGRISLVENNVCSYNTC
jgi:hypothetical protein